jgi:3,4-dihydroxy 2-butanone 4-phosphate synthase / GTP cyclohydrolase II
MSKILPLSGKATTAPAAAPLNSVGEMLAELRAGHMVIVVDDEDRENEGDLIMAAEHATAEAVAFMIRHTSGIICVPMEEAALARLELPQMVPVNSESQRTAFTVSVDLRVGTTTGVSSADRAATIRALASPTSTAADFARPGHIFPLRSRRGGVLVRAGHTEAAVDLCHLAGLTPIGVLCEVMNDDGSMARRPQLQEFARTHGLKIGTIADLIRHRLRTERTVVRISEQSVQTELGEFRLYAYQDEANQEVHVALAHGRLDGPEMPLVRVHVADTMRDLLGLRGTGRTWTLRAAMQRIVEAGNGVVVVLRQQESARELAEAVRSFAAPPPAAPTEGSSESTEGTVLRTFGVGAQILKDLNVKRMRVLSAPKQMHGISAFGLEVDSYVGDEA